MTIFNFRPSKKYEKHQINKKAYFKINMISLAIELSILLIILEVVISPKVERILGWMLFYGGLYHW